MAKNSQKVQSSQNGNQAVAEAPRLDATPTVPTEQLGNNPALPTGKVPEDPPIHRASAYGVAQKQFDNVADFMELDDDIRGYLRNPQREMIVHFPVKMDDDSLRMFSGFRVHHNTTKGPTKGGMRYHPDVTLDE